MTKWTGAVMVSSSSNSVVTFHLDIATMANHALQMRLFGWGTVLLLGWLPTGCSPSTGSSDPTPPSSPTPTSPTPEPSAAVPPRPTETGTPSPSIAASPSPTLAPDASPNILHKIRKDLSDKVAIAKQDTGKTYLSALLLSQQAERLVKGSFSSDLNQFAQDVPTDTEEYRIEVRRADAQQAILVAVAKQPGFASYTGVVYAVEGKIPVTAICKTNLPSQMPPQAPLLGANATILPCPPGSARVQ